jgi:hypothetical protein
VTDLDALALMQIKPGQWIECMGARGQYLGTTTTGTVIVRWQKEGRKFGQGGTDHTKDARANAVMRDYAKNYGAK